MRPAVTGSLSSAMPRIAVPAAPMPTQTAYAVPIGSVRAATASRYMLAMIAAIVKTLGQSLVNPLVYLSPMAQPTSSKPAMMRMIQAKTTLLFRSRFDSPRSAGEWLGQ